MRHTSSAPICPICQSPRLYYLFSVEQHRLLNCSDCSHIMIYPQPSDAELAVVSGKMTGGEETGKQYLDIIAEYCGQRGGRLLEIGFGDAGLRTAAAAQGYQTTSVSQSVIGELANSNSQFDVCVLADVIEQVRDPKTFLMQIHRLLAPNGVLFVATPSLDAKTRPKDFKPENFHYYRQKTLTSLLWQNGYGYVITVPGAPGMMVVSTKTDLTDRKRLSVIVPAFNEVQTLGPMLDRLIAKDLDPLEKEIVLVESNSTDGTREIALNYQNHPNVRLILEDRPQGKGHAVRTGLASATGDFVLIQDADLEYDMDDYDVLLEPLLRGRHAFTLGARHGGKAWKLRQFNDNRPASMLFNLGHSFFRTLFNVLYGTHLLDPFTMYKVFRRDCLSGLTFDCNYFDFDYELVIKLILKGFVPIEIPVNYRSRSFSEGKKVSIFRDPITWIKALLKFRFVKLDLLHQTQLARRAFIANEQSASRAANSLA